MNILRGIDGGIGSAGHRQRGLRFWRRSMAQVGRIFAHEGAAQARAAQAAHLQGLVAEQENLNECTYGCPAHIAERSIVALDKDRSAVLWTNPYDGDAFNQQHIVKGRGYAAYIWHGTQAYSATRLHSQDRDEILTYAPDPSQDCLVTLGGLRLDRDKKVGEEVILGCRTVKIAVGDKERFGRRRICGASI